MNKAKASKSNRLNTGEAKNIKANKSNKSRKTILIIIGALILAGVIVAAIIVPTLVYLNSGPSEGSIGGELESELSVNYSDNGSLKFVDGEFSDINVNSKDDALAALESLKSELKFIDAKEEFASVSEEEIDDIVYYQFNQQYKGTPIDGQTIVVSADKKANNKPNGFSGTYIPNINISTIPEKSQEEAEQSLKDKLGETAVVLAPELKISLTSDDTPVLTYIVAAYSETVEPKKYVVDANTAEILWSSSLIHSFGTYEYEGEGIYDSIKKEIPSL